MALSSRVSCCYQDRRSSPMVFFEQYWSNQSWIDPLTSKSIQTSFWIKIWRFPESWGYPQSSSTLIMGFSLTKTNHLGVPPFVETLIYCQWLGFAGKQLNTGNHAGFLIHPGAFLSDFPVETNPLILCCSH